MKKIYSALLLCLSAIISSHAQTWTWAHQSTNDNTYSHASATDGAGNVYVTGYFTNMVDFDGQSLTTSGGREIYLAKYDPAGALLWIKSAGSPNLNSFEQGTDIAVTTAGDVYVIGDFSDVASFDAINVTATPAIIANATNCFVAKYNTDGDAQWVLPIGSSANGTASGQAVAIDGAGDVLITGSYFGATMLDTISLAGCTNCTNVFVAKLNPDGHALWARSSNGTGLVINFSRSIATDGNNNVIVSGQTNGSVSFGGTTMAGTPAMDAYVAKYDGSGTFQWAVLAGGTGTDDIKRVTADANGNCYVAGSFAGTASFGSLSLTAASSDLFIAQLDATGSFVWANKADAPSSFINDMITDAAGNSYMTGLTAGGSFGGLNATMGGFIVKYNNAGAGISLYQMPTFSTPFGVSFHSSGDLISNGILNGSATFGSTTLTGNGFTTNMYVARMVQNVTSIGDANTTSAGFTIFPNPATGSACIQRDLWNEDAIVVITDIAGRIVSTSTGKELHISGLTPGVYNVSISDAKTKAMQRLVINP